MQIGQADPKPFSVTMQVTDLQIIIYYKAEKELIKGTGGIFFLWYVFKCVQFFPGWFCPFL